MSTSESISIPPAARPISWRNRRAELRLKVRMPVSLEQDSAIVARVSGDLSPRGFFMETTEPPPVGSRVKVSLLLVDTHERVTMEATVQHRIPPDHPGIRGPGVGLRFSSMTLKQRRRWRRDATPCPCSCGRPP